jgi:hypothetical protein
LRQHHELLGICGSLGTAQDCVITGAIGFETEPAPRRPDERVKPVQRAHDARHEADQPVAATNVFELVYEGLSQIAIAPCPGIGGQHDDRTNEAARHGPQDFFMKEDVDRPPDTSVDRQPLGQMAPPPSGSTFVQIAYLCKDKLCQSSSPAPLKC